MADDDLPPWDPDSLDDDEFLDEWEAVDREAAALVREECAEVLAEPPPQPDLAAAAAALRSGVQQSLRAYEYVRRACGWWDPPDVDDADLWLTAAAATVSPPLDPDLGAESLSAIAALRHADWFGMVAGLVRRGVGARFDDESVLRDIDRLADETDDFEDDDGAVVGHAVVVLAPLWEALGILDGEETLTPLGRWGLPRVLLRTWDPDDLEDQEDDRYADLDPAAQDLVVHLLAERPRTVPELRSELAKQGVFVDADRLERALTWPVAGHARFDGSYVHVPSMAEDAWLTHRVTKEELALGVLEADVDLALLALLADEPVCLAEGGVLLTRYALYGEPLPGDCGVGLAGPDGWLTGVEPGDLVGLRYSGGQIHLERLAAPPAAEEETVEAFLRAADEATERDLAEPDPDGPGVAVHDIVLELLLDRRSALSRPQPPLSDVLNVSGLETRSGFVGAPGTPWDAGSPWVSEPDRRTLNAWRRATRSFRRDGTVPPREELEGLATGMTGLALDLAAVDVTAAPELDALLTGMVESASGGTAAAGATYLRARTAEGRRDLPARTRLLEAVLDLDPRHPDAAADLAELRAVAGDAHEAYRLYRVAGVQDGSDEIRALRPFLSPPEGEVGRNRPCPCGSGRKYKLCHGKTARHPLPARSEWLWAKAVTYAQRGLHRETVLSWAQRYSGEGLHERRTVALAMASGVVLDAAVFDGGILADFVDTHAALLPDDERDLARRWLDSSRRLMEVQQARPLHGIALRDLATGEGLDLPDRTLARKLAAKDVILGRPLDDGAGALRILTDPLVVPRLMRGPLLEILRGKASGEEVLELLAHGDPSDVDVGHR